MKNFTRVAIYLLLSAPLSFALASGCGSSGGTGTSSGASTNAGGAGSTGSNSGGNGVGGASNSTGSNTGGAGTTSTSTSTSTATSGSGGHPVTPCQGHVYQCGDGIDNDNDGLIDSDDPDCLGPCDNTENSYYGGIPGQNNAPCKADCYFDQDTGPGNDDCYWNHACDPHETAPDYYPEVESGSQCKYDPNANTPGTNKTCAELDAMQSDTCHKVCGPLTPNGCDCFGCCELPAGSKSYVYLGSLDPKTSQPSCDLAHVADPTKCHPCQPVAACLNDCGHCELCIGKDMLPPDCNPDGGSGSGSTSTSTSSSSSSGSGGGGSQCPPDVQPCGAPGQSPCPNNYYCITGCCQAIPG